MERCIYLENSIYADQIKIDFNEEQKIRVAGRERKLTCYGCGKPVIYKRGEIRDAHFAHIDCIEPCNYEEYTKYCSKRSPSWKVVKEILYYHLSNLYPDVIIERDERLFRGHYTDFYVKLNNGIAIEIDDKTMTAQKLIEFYDQYHELGITVDWIVLDTVKTFSFDYQSYYIKRSRLNESINHTVIVVDKHDFSFCIFKLDTNQYIYSNNMEFKFRENVFSYPFDFEKLKISDQGLTVEGFESEYQKWLDRRVYEFNRRDTELYKNSQYFWDEDKYIEVINQIMNGDRNHIDGLVTRLTKYKNEFDIFRDLYIKFKELNVEYYVETFEEIINKTKKEIQD